MRPARATASHKLPLFFIVNLTNLLHSSCIGQSSQQRSRSKNLRSCAIAAKKAVASCDLRRLVVVHRRALASTSSSPPQVSRAARSLGWLVDCSRPARLRAPSRHGFICATSRAALLDPLLLPLVFHCRRAARSCAATPLRLSYLVLELCSWLGRRRRR